MFPGGCVIALRAFVRFYVVMHVEVLFEFVLIFEAFWTIGAGEWNLGSVVLG